MNFWDSPLDRDDGDLATAAAHAVETVGARHLEHHAVEAAEEERLRATLEDYREWGGMPFVARIEVDWPAACTLSAGTRRRRR